MKPLKFFLNDCEFFSIVKRFFETDEIFKNHLIFFPTQMQLFNNFTVFFSKRMQFLKIVNGSFELFGKKVKRGKP